MITSPISLHLANASASLAPPEDLVPLIYVRLERLLGGDRHSKWMLCSTMGPVIDPKPVFSDLERTLIAFDKMLRGSLALYGRKHEEVEY